MRDIDITTLPMAQELGITADEYDYVCRILNRNPNYAEMGIFSAMYSEHCSYKSSKRFLKRFPTEGKRVLQGPGENAGIIDIGSGWAVAFKMESHNHPSFIEPYQGAATGVGGILRDVFTMGARPIACMDGLYFGNTDFEKTPAVAKGVVKGVGDYGNCVGIPTVAGQTFFHKCYNGNPLLNAFTLGLVRHENIFRGYASGIGNLVIYGGAKTGRDGVHGANMASKEFSTEKELDRPAVQVGDPFTEKLVLEASLEIMHSGLVVGIQDMGAAGITSSSFEMAHRAGTGLRIDLDKIPTRESHMSAFELLLSESQERMLLVAKPGNLKKIQEVFEKWDLHAEAVGEVIEGDRVVMTYQGNQVVDIPVDIVVNPPTTNRPTQEPKSLSDLWHIDEKSIQEASWEKKVDTLLDDFNFAQANPICEQYDSMVGIRTKGGTYDDAAVMRIREITDRTVEIAMSMDCNPRICLLWPREGGRRAVAESAINLAVQGAEGVGLTDCLNFGSPENPEVLWQFEEAVEGISESCRALGVPVVSGNVSFYNDTDGQPILPTPMIGMVGVKEGYHPLPHSTLYQTDLEVGLIGTEEAGLGGSTFAALWFQKECGKPDATDLTVVKQTQDFLLQLREQGLTYAAHDISDGGLLLAIAEMAFLSKTEGIGVQLSIPDAVSADKFLFGETIPRVLLAYSPSDRSPLESLASQAGVPFRPIGQTNNTNQLSIKQSGVELVAKSLSEIKNAWANRWKELFQ